MTTTPRRREVRPVDFGAPEVRPASGGAETAPPWETTTAKVTAWLPESDGAPPDPADVGEAPPPPPRAPTTTLLQRPTPIEEPTPEPRASAVPPGMILISREEMAERESEIRDEYRKHYLASATRLREAIGELDQRLREDIVDLAARIATVLVQRAIQHDRSITLDIARRALQRLGPVERIIVKCAESDAELLRERLSAMASTEMGQPVEVVVRPSSDIDAGGIVVTFDGGVVDAREDKRLARIVDAVKAAVRESDAILESARDRARGAEGGEDER